MPKMSQSKHPSKSMKKPRNAKNISLWVPPHVLKALRVKVAIEDTTVQKFLSKAIEEFVKDIEIVPGQDEDQ